MTRAEKQDVIELIRSFKPDDLQDNGNKRVAESVDEITNAIEGMVETKDWIACSDMMPPENQDVLCYVAQCGVQLGAWVGYMWITDGYREDITHWMYLPESPEEDDDEPTNHCQICGSQISCYEQICKECQTKYGIGWGDSISRKLHEYIVKMEKDVKP